MAVSLLSNGVSDICLGKPALKSLSISATVGDALSSLKRSPSRSSLSVWSCEIDDRHHQNCVNLSGCNNCECVGKVCMVDVVCFLAKEENLKNPGIVFLQPLSVLLSDKGSLGLVRHLEPHASLLEAIDLILEGAQNLVVPVHNPFTRKKLNNKRSSNSTLHNNGEYCWVTQEDIIRYLLNSISLFSPTAGQSIESLNIIDSNSVLVVHYDDPASSVSSLILQSLVEQTSVAVLDSEGRLIGEISPSAINFCDEGLAAAIVTLSAGDLMTYIECAEPPEDLVQLVKDKLEEMDLGAAIELIDDDSGASSAMSSSSYSSSSEDELGLGRSGRVSVNSTRMRSRETVVCYPWSSMVAVMIQALSHRVSYVWVVEEDGTLVGVVTFVGMIKVFRESLNSMV